MLEAVVFGHGDGEAQATCFEGSGRIGSFFFNVEAGVAFAVEHGRPALAEGDGVYVGQHAGVAPHAEARGRCCCAGGDVFTLRGLAELVHVVADIERACAEGAEGLWGVSRYVMVATRALERSNDSHILDVTVKPRWAAFRPGPLRAERSLRDRCTPSADASVGRGERY